MGLKRIALANGLVLLLVAACGGGSPVGSPSSSPISSPIGEVAYPKGITVTSIDDACKAITPEEINALVGSDVKRLDEGPAFDVIRDTATGKALTPDPAIGRQCRFASHPEEFTKGTLMAFLVLLDPSEDWYNYGSEPRNSGQSTIDNVTPVDGLGDKAFVNRPTRERKTYVGYTARWGVWTAKAIVITLAGPTIKSEEGLADALRAMLSGSPAITGNDPLTPGEDHDRLMLPPPSR